MSSEVQYIDAWQLQVGDEIRLKSKGYTELATVIALYWHTQEVQGRSSAVTVVTRSTYSPNWHVFKSDRTMAITKRQ